MELSRRMQVAGPEPERGRAAEGTAPRGAQRLEPGRHLGDGRQIGQDREVVAASGAPAQVVDGQGW